MCKKVKVKNRKYGCDVYTVHAHIHIPWSESDYKAREARGLLRCGGHYSSLRPCKSIITCKCESGRNCMQMLVREIVCKFVCVCLLWGKENMQNRPQNSPQ